jgi:EAL domain-containing protein (putative c-di-GMP-specific phosphodiesterase class I)
VPFVRRAGARVLVDGVETEAQAQWWRAAGAVAGTGSLLGVPTPPGEFPLRRADTIG